MNEIDLKYSKILKICISVGMAGSGDPYQGKGPNKDCMAHQMVHF